MFGHLKSMFVGPAVGELEGMKVLLGSDVGRCVATDGDRVVVGLNDGSIEGLDVTGIEKLEVGVIEGKVLREESHRPRPSLTELKITSELPTEHCELRIKATGERLTRSTIEITKF